MFFFAPLCRCCNFRPLNRFFGCCFFLVWRSDETHSSCVDESVECLDDETFVRAAGSSAAGILPFYGMMKSSSSVCGRLLNDHEAHSVGRARSKSSL